MFYIDTIFNIFKRYLFAILLDFPPHTLNFSVHQRIEGFQQLFGLELQFLTHDCVGSFEP